MASPIHQVFFQDGEFRRKHAYKSEDFENGSSVYEVFRIIDGKPLFLERHLKRLYKSGELSGTPVRESELTIRNWIYEVIIRNDVREGNMQVIFHTEPAQKKDHILVSFIAHSYPSEEMYRMGVKIETFRAERKNPNAKVRDPRLRAKLNEHIENRGLFEIALVDREGFITEGSKSNLFFIRRDSVLTPPSSRILSGTTRAAVLEILEELGLPLSEQLLTEKDLNTLDAMFISGTSPKILPVSSLNGIKLDTGHFLLRKVMHAFDIKVSNYLEGVRNSSPKI